jgi:hypothetical protein
MATEEAEQMEAMKEEKQRKKVERDILTCMSFLVLPVLTLNYSKNLAT